MGKVPAMASTSISGHLALVGLMGTGKSSVGRILAERTGRELIDTDALVQGITGRSIGELFAGEGEAAFRRYELDSLHRSLARNEPVIVATGGGVVLTPDARQALERDATVVWLRADPDLLARRLDGDRSRPLLSGHDPLATLRDLHDHRAPLYAEVADVVVDIGDRSADEVADEVLDVLGWQP